MGSKALSPAEQLARPLRGWDAFGFYWCTVREAHIGLRPSDDGSTPVINTVVALGMEAVGDYVRAARDQQSALRTQIRENEATLADATAGLARAQEVLATVPPAPDLATAPPRALETDKAPINKQLEKTLVYANLNSDLKKRRASCDADVARLTADGIQLRERRASLDGQLVATQDHLRAQADLIAAAVNRRIAKYTVTFVRRHRDRAAVQKLLPLKQVTGAELLAPYLSQPIGQLAA